jgi:hypothetical protein
MIKADQIGNKITNVIQCQSNMQAKRKDGRGRGAYAVAVNDVHNRGQLALIRTIVDQYNAACELAQA